MFRRLWTFPRRNGLMRMAMLMYWEIAVEIPAPRTPSFRTKIRNMSPKENVIHNAAGCHGWCCNKDPGAIFDRVRKDGVSASKETHEGSVEEKAKDANEGAT